MSRRPGWCRCCLPRHRWRRYCDFETFLAHSNGKRRAKWKATETTTLLLADRYTKPDKTRSIGTSKFAAEAPLSFAHFRRTYRARCASARLYPSRDFKLDLGDCATSQKANTFDRIEFCASDLGKMSDRFERTRKTCKTRKMRQREKRKEGAIETGDKEIQIMRAESLNNETRCTHVMTPRNCCNF